MNRVTLLMLVAVAIAVPRPVLSQVLTAPTSKTVRQVAPRPASSLTIDGSTQPDPLLRYRMWPAPADRVEDNAVVLISRAVILHLQVTKETKQKFSENFNRWMEMPVSELPKQEVRDLLGRYKSALRELDRAQDLMQINYPLQLDRLSGSEWLSTLLPEFQEMRGLARLVSLRAKLAVAEGRWQDMVEDCRVGFRLAEVAGHSTDFLVGRLIGFAISSMMMNVIETAIQQPNCPSLYWALVSIPGDQLFETRESLEFESILISRIFHNVGELPDHPIGASSAREKFRQIVDEAQKMILEWKPGQDQSSQARLLAGAYIVVMTDPSRDLLAETSQWGEKAYDLSPPEAVLRATMLTFARARDRWVAWSMLPPGLFPQYESEWKKSLDTQSSPADPLVGIVHMLTPSVDAAMRAGLRTQQLHHWLITVEAIRLHAGVTGELPESLRQLQPVPAWDDAIARQPFGYQRSTPNSATLTRATRYPDDPETTFQIELKRSK